MTQRAFKLNRDVTKTECGWIDRDFKAGEIVYPCRKPTYGASPNMTPVTHSAQGDYPFFELPDDALDNANYLY